MAKPVLPKRFHDAIRGWVVDGIKPGGFLTAVLKSDLKGAFLEADLASVEELEELAGIIAFFYNHLPRNCWGSVESVQKWPEHLESLPTTQRKALQDVLNALLLSSGRNLSPFIGKQDDEHS